MTHIKGGWGSVSKLPVGSSFLVPDRPSRVIETVIGLGTVRLENLGIWSSQQVLFPLLPQASWKPKGGRVCWSPSLGEACMVRPGLVRPLGLLCDCPTLSPPSQPFPSTHF